jgi:RES domain-containing protein
LEDKWIKEKRSAALRAPSVVTRGEYNYLVNPRHPDFSKIKAKGPRVFRFDQRIG